MPRPSFLSQIPQALALQRQLFTQKIAIATRLRTFSTEPSSTTATALADAHSASIPVSVRPPLSSPSPCPRNLTFAPATPSPRLRAKKLAFFVSRTPSRQLPVYHLTKRGGNKKLTRVKNIEGNTPALVQNLRAELGMKKDEVQINPLTGHVILRGHRAFDVKKYLTELGF